MDAEATKPSSVVVLYRISYRSFGPSLYRRLRNEANEILPNIMLSDRNLDFEFLFIELRSKEKVGTETAVTQKWAG